MSVASPGLPAVDQNQLHSTEKLIHHPLASQDCWVSLLNYDPQNQLATGELNKGALCNAPHSHPGVRNPMFYQDANSSLQFPTSILPLL